MRIAASLLALLVLISGIVPAVAAVDGSDAVGPETDPSATADRLTLNGPVASIDEPRLTEIYIAPDPGGDARWTVSIRYNLSSETDRQAFDRYGRSFEDGDTDVGLDADFFRALAAEASESTAREMSIRNTDRNATVRNGTGVISLSFTWTNFVTDTENGFEVQDSVLMPGNRTWLSSIGPSQRLIIETPDEYQVTDTRFGLDNGSVVIDGPHTFEEPLSVSYQQTATEQEPPWSLIGGALLVGLGLVAAAIYARRRGVDTEVVPSPTTDEPRETEGGAAAEATEEATGDVAEEASGEAEETESAVDPSLLSDEERVEHLLERNGGRMKQGQIVRETGWSDAKVSQLLSTMADEDRIEKLRLGRENLISLAEEDES
ncbi:helix-turn-helix transcriptional regulator [Haloplanus halobius]|uniref:helix-turn-helix transcriptional regulator n=1 Tax=Haloplanus halobius TaxID=2934938 RepID=UPI0020109AAF|nr:hypothetical protein [Haloplanus sp. XH21]